MTGGAGFVGSHLVERLVDEGCRVRVLANYKSHPGIGNLAFTPPEVREQVEVVWGDICDRDSVLRVVEGTSLVFHLAALIGIPYSYVAPGSYVQTNIVGTLNVLQAARTCGVERLVHTSTSEVYGSAQYTPMDERHPLVGQSPYAATKIAADKLVESFGCSFELPVTTIRPFNIFGPRQSDRAIVPTIIAQRASGREGVQIGDPTPRRDFTFVTDTVDAFVRASVRDSAVGRTIHVGSGASMSMGEIAQRICDRMGGGTVASDNVRTRPATSEVRELVADSALAKSLLGWKPHVDLDTGLDRTIDFVRRHPERFVPGSYRV